jgi:hypothetical protein
MSTEPPAAAELRQLRREISGLHSRIIDVEIRLAWLRLYGIQALGMLIIVVVVGAEILSR